MAVEYIPYGDVLYPFEIWSEWRQMLALAAGYEKKVQDCTCGHTFHYEQLKPESSHAQVLGYNQSCASFMVTKMLPDWPTDPLAVLLGIRPVRDEPAARIMPERCREMADSVRLVLPLVPAEWRKATEFIIRHLERCASTTPFEVVYN